jgi:ketosteroid isomerase-like protein
MARMQVAVCHHRAGGGREPASLLQHGGCGARRLPHTEPLRLAQAIERLGHLDAHVCRPRVPLGHAGSVPPYAGRSYPGRVSGRKGVQLVLHSPQSAIEIIFADWLDAIRSGDVKRMAGRLAPDVVHHGVRPDLVCTGREAVLFRVGTRAAHPPTVDAIELVAAGDQVVLSVRGPELGVGLEEGESPRGQASMVFTLRQGLIVKIQDYPSRGAALEAAGADGGWQ